MNDIRKTGRLDERGSLSAIIYCRVAASSVADETILHVQATRAKQYAAACGYPVTKVIREAGTSGMRIDRSGINEIFQIIDAGQKTTQYVVITSDPFRLTRDATAYRDLCDRLALSGTRLEFCESRAEWRLDPSDRPVTNIRCKGPQ